MKKENLSFMLPIVGGTIPVVIILSSYYSIPTEFSIIFSTIGVLIFGSMVLWQYAISHANGNEWWQDNHCSGWRGY